MGGCALFHRRTTRWCNHAGALLRHGVGHMGGVCCKEMKTLIMRGDCLLEGRRNVGLLCLERGDGLKLLT